MRCLNFNGPFHRVRSFIGAQLCNTYMYKIWKLCKCAFVSHFVHLLRFVKKQQVTKKKTTTKNNNKQTNYNTHFKNFLTFCQLIYDSIDTCRRIWISLFLNCKEGKLYPYNGYQHFEYFNIIWASTRENLSSGVWEQHRRRPACASAQSDQRLCYSLFRKYHIETCCRWNFNFLASLCCWGDWFETRFVGHPEDRFSRDEAQYYFSFTKNDRSPYRHQRLI